MDLAARPVPKHIETIPDRYPAQAHVGQVDEEIGAKSTGPVSEHTVRGPAVVGPHRPHPADQDGHFGGGETHELGPVQKQLSGLTT